MLTSNSRYYRLADFRKGIKKKQKAFRMKGQEFGMRGICKDCV